MAFADLHSLDVLIIHDEAFFGSIRYNSIGLVEQVENINNQTNLINNAPASDVYTRPEASEIFDTNADKTDTYTKTETDVLLEAKADIIDTYTKSEDDAFLLLKADKSDTYSKTEDDALLLLKTNVADIADSYSMTEDDALLQLKADKSDKYFKTEYGVHLLLKANVADIADSYSMTEDDALVLLKTNKFDTYSKSETETLLDAKADKSELIDSYSKTENDSLLSLKANVVDLTNYVDLTSAQTITGQKQFGVISVSSISKLSKNDASNLLAGGGYMLVSSLVTQPQLQEGRNIATGKSKAYVFSTQDELNDWMADQENVAKLVTGDNLYIVDKEVTDYWWDGTDIKVLETELPDMSNVITTLGTATGGGNVIIDISIDGNILTSAKSKNFVDTDYNQSISGQKTFNTIIHFVEIMVKTYDNSSVVCMRGGVRSIADIQSASYTKSEDNALLLLKADKTQLIDSYTKGETDNLLNIKVDTRISYSKRKNNAFLLMKADKTQLIDSYSNGETNNLLDNVVNQSTTYIKTETDQLISEIDVEDIDLTDYYNKIKTDELLVEKADATELSNYMTLGTEQTTNANKTINNACRFKSTIYGMSTINGTSFVKSGADNSVVLLGAGGTKPISEFTITIDDSNYVKKDCDVQDIKGILRKITIDQLYPEPTDDDYITLGAVKSEIVSSIQSGSINGNLITTQFLKSNGTNQQVLLENETMKLLSEFASGSVDDSNFVKKTGQATLSNEGNLIRSGSKILFENLQPFQFINKQDAKFGFVQNEGKYVQEIEAKLRRKQDDKESQDGDYLTKEEMDNKYVSFGGTQTITVAKILAISVTAHAL
ncbi:MAG: hypothetical protein EZS28_005546 [Streblomastix strix]|uniref:Uncharacterized protein n=1 Tax=Streblomastix strix TaxID=222440 RepID=A0A5J4WWK9_9EUKA|nr:MAG: hypothetical protein EZS28_005546 [Streblomastix strix]